MEANIIEISYHSILVVRIKTTYRDEKLFAIILIEKLFCAGKNHLQREAFLHGSKALTEKLFTRIKTTYREAFYADQNHL